MSETTQQLRTTGGGGGGPEQAGWQWDLAENRVILSVPLCAELGLSFSSKGLTCDEFLALVHPEDRRRMRGIFYKIYRRPRDFDYDFRLTGTQGRCLRLRGRGRLAGGDDKPLIRGLPGAGDTAELDHPVLSGAGEGCLLLSITGEVRDANPAYCTLLGRDRHALLGMTLFDLEEGNAAGIRQRLQWLAADGHMRYETRHRRVDGGWVDVEVSASVVHTPQGARICAFVRDIRERCMAREESRRLTTYLQLLLDSAGEGIYSVDLDGRCTFINRAAQEMLGYSRHEVLGRKMHELVHHTQAGAPVDAAAAPVATVLTTGKGVRVNNEVIWRKNGSAFSAEYSSYPIIEGGRIAGAVVVFRDVTEARTMAMQLKYQASHDALTGLANRREFQIRLDHALAQARQEGGRHVLLFLDLDQFKVVNDTCGHAAGDQLLRTLAERLKAMIRSGDTLARLGGDEFGMLLRNCGLDYGLELAERMRESVQEFRFQWEGNSFNIGASIGVVPVTADSLNVAALLSAADAACYSAKDSGRNRVRLYRPNDTGLIRRQGDMRWIGQIHQALKENRLRLFYQSLAPLNPDEPKGRHIEILVKMEDFQGRLIPPGAFLPAAERAGLTPEIDRWVVANSFEWILRHAHRPDRLRLCSINLSGHSISDTGFLEFVIDQFKRHRLPPSMICFEVTETVAIANLANARRLFTTLSHMGCKFALDDFGTGVASYGYLKTLPVDYLKIDGSFVRDIATDPIDYALVKSINDIGHVMGKKTIAEYVETEEILARVKAMGIDYAQGYYIDAAEPIDTLRFD